MSAFTDLLRTNRNYRWMWGGQIVSEIGDWFNTIAVLSLAMEFPNSGLVVTGVFLSRAVAVLAAGPIAGVLLDRLSRKRVMVASDLVRAVVAPGFILCAHHTDVRLIFLFSGMLMFASPFFTSGRVSTLPTIATPAELHTANTITQTTSWATLTLGTFFAAIGMTMGYDVAFLFNALSFLISAFCISRLQKPGGFRSVGASDKQEATGFAQYREGLAYIRKTPVIAGIALIGVGWATGGGAAQVLFSLFGEKVFHRGPTGISIIWGFAGVGLLVGAAIGYWLGKRLTFEQYKRTVTISYLIHGIGYVAFSQMPTIGLACLFITISRAAVAVSSVLNVTQLLRHIEARFRGRVFATIESLTWSSMMISMMAAGLATMTYSPRQIGACAGLLSSTTGLFWWWANRRGMLPEPPRHQVEHEEDREMKSEPALPA